jgi:hypothetical protein
MVLGKLGIHMQKIGTKALSLTLHKNQFKMDQRSFNVRSKTLKLLQKKTGKALEDRGIGNNFQNRTPIAQEIKA